jgi:hypothetical protein
MPRRWKIAIGTVSSICGIVLIVNLLTPREPQAEGKPLSRWLADLDVGSTQSRERAEIALRGMGTNAFPWLRGMLRAKEPWWKGVVRSFNAHQDAVHIPLLATSTVRYRAVQGYQILSSNAKEDVLELAQMLETETAPEVRACTALALGAIGRAAVAAEPALLKAASDPNEEVRRNARAAIMNVRMSVPDLR